MNKVGAAVQILRGIGAPVNSKTVGAMVGWFNAEGGHWNNSAHFNPLNTTQGAPGASAINSVGVKSYGNWGQGIQATVQTLKNGHYGGILQAFHNSDPQGVARAIGSSPWGTDGQLVAHTIGQSIGQRFAIPSGGPRGVAQQMSAPSAPQSSPTSGQGPGPTTDWGTAIADAMLQSSAAPVDASGKVRLDTSLQHAINAVAQGQYTTPGASTASPPTGNAVLASAARGRMGMNHEADLNPLQHFTLGRTDMGVDANAAPGTPILAPNKAVVLGVMPNWYHGQPYVALRILAGPNAGKVMYVAEQITGVARVGQVLQRGQPIARYAASGTGIEAGWANPQNWQQTLAQSTGQLGTGDHSNAPAGAQFRNYLGSTSAR